MPFDLRLIIDIAFEVVYWLIIARVFLSFIRPDPYHPVVRFINETTEPILAPFRRLMPRGTLPVDFSPFIAIMVLYFVRYLLLRLF
ncbi:YggT family protein [Metallumcola ferriviriculae]|uniref:YggT family protein n=1 Tax=Metallumcola ferriviriculae TaxID=3039180 RepID=A0AAU0UPB0_9FIRM|nr:YggT family protein [Desulfitibacteraceae bacterium MK1]